MKRKKRIEKKLHFILHSPFAMLVTMQYGSNAWNFRFSSFLVWARFWSLIYWISFWFPALLVICTESKTRTLNLLWTSTKWWKQWNCEEKKKHRKRGPDDTSFLRVYLLINDERKMKFSLLNEGLHFYLLRALCTHVFLFVVVGGAAAAASLAQLWIIVAMMVRPGSQISFRMYHIFWSLCSELFECVHFTVATRIILVTLSWCRKP